MQHVVSRDVCNDDIKSVHEATTNNSVHHDACGKRFGELVKRASVFEQVPVRQPT